MIENNEDAKLAGGRPKGGKDNPMNQRKMPNGMMAQQKAINEKNSKAKKAANTKAKQQQVQEIEQNAKKECPAMSLFDRRPKKPATA